MEVSYSFSPHTSELDFLTDGPEPFSFNHGVDWSSWNSAETVNAFLTTLQRVIS